MRKKIIGILICIMLLITGVLTTLITPEKTHVIAYPDEVEPEKETGLDMEYIWNQLKNFSNVTYNAYLPDDIPKGRSFGSKGGIYTVNILQNEMNDNLSLDNVKNEPLKYIDESYNNYSSIINVSDFQITFQTQQGAQVYPYPNPIPKTEMYIIPHRDVIANDKQKKSTWSGNWSFGNLTNITSILPVDFEKIVDPIGETQHSEYTLDDYVLLNDETLFILGSADYLAPDNPIPEEDLLTVFIIDDVEGAQDKN